MVMPDMDREKLYLMLAKKDWDGIAKVLASNYMEVMSDPVGRQASNLFETEFFSELEGKPHTEILKLLELPYLVIETSSSAFSQDFRFKVVELKIQHLEAVGREEAALSLAFNYQSLPAAKEIIKRVHTESPERMADAKRGDSRITANTISKGNSAKRSLFRSGQEENFFLAMRSAFPTFVPYPNVALNAVIDFDQIKGSLSDRERDFFFRAMVDSVVFDPNIGYTPLYFFELDSSHHDNPVQAQRDAMKDKIFEVANVKLHRVRAWEKSETTIKEFYKLILELVR